MEVISIDGVEYIRASQLAKRFKYTSDYIGQLCRSGKVDAKLVGRTWYVNPDSLEGHKDTRYVKVRQNKKTISESTQVKISRQNVEPVVRKETAKSLASTERRGGSNYLRRIEWKPLKYELDESELLPPLSPAESVKVDIDLAEATKVRIKSGPTETELVTEPLPAVSLAGRLKVASLDDDFEKDLENIDISDADEFSVPVEAVPEEEEVVVGHEDTKEKEAVRFRSESIQTSHVADPLNPVYPVAIRQEHERPRFAPSRVRHSAENETKPSGVSALWWVVLFICAVGGALLVTSLTTVSVASSSIFETSYLFTNPTL